MGFSQGDFIWSEKVELKENYTRWNKLFYSKDHTCRLKENTFVYKEMQSGIFPVYNFFVERRSHVQTSIFCLQRIRVFKKAKRIKYINALKIE